MSFALAILLGLVSLCPAIVTVDAPLPYYLIPFLLAAGLMITSVKLPEGEAQHLAKVISRPVVLLAAFPVALIILQLLPLSFLANPVWTSVSPGFPHGISGSISVDIGATAIALVRYLSTVGMVMLAAGVAVNRERAKSVLIGATAAAILISFAMLLHDFFGLNILAMREQALDSACLGVTLSLSCGLLVLERHETRRTVNDQTRRKFLTGMVASLIGFVICASAVGMAKSGSLIFAAGAGVLTFVSVTAIRRWSLGPVGAGAIGITAIVIAASLVTVAASDPDPRFAFVKKDSAAVELTQRILNDAPFFGDGAGSFSALLPIYQSSETGLRDAEAVTAAAKLSIEMGRAMLWVAVLAASFAVFMLLRGASQRGRDSFYAAGAGACLVTLMILAFINVAASGLGVVLLFAAIFGLGLTQSKGRVLS